MMIKPFRLMIIVIVCFFLVNIVATIILLENLKTNSLNQWTFFVSRYIEEKNIVFHQSFFENVTGNDIVKIRSLNYFYFDGLINGNQSLSDYNIVGINIYHINGEKLHSYRKFTDNEYISDDKIFGLVHDNLTHNSPIVENISHDGRYLSIVTAPIQTMMGQHYISLVYIFDIDRLIIRTLSFNMINTISTFIFFSLTLITIIIFKNYNNYIKNINKFVEVNIFDSPNKKNTNFKLHFLQPFDKLEKNITFLLSQRKQIEEKYLEISEKLFYLVQMTTEGIIMEDYHGFIFYSNKRLAKILDYRDEKDLYGVKFTDLFLFEGEVEKYQSEKKLRQIKNNYSYKFSLRSRTGQRKDIRLTATVMTNHEGEIMGYYGIIVDISGISIISENQIQFLHLRSQIIESNPNPITILDENDFIIDTNDAFVNFVNKNRSDIIQNSMENVIKGLEIEKAFLSGINELEFYDPTQNEWYHVNIRNIKSNDVEYKYIIFYIVGHFRNQQQHHKLIFEDYRGFFFVTNKENKVVFLSPSFQKITQHSDIWFKSYYSSLINLSPNKSLNLFEPMHIISQNKVKLEFKLYQLYTNNQNLLLFQAALK